jgi:hypothetical protein
MRRIEEKIVESKENYREVGKKKEKEKKLERR